MSTRTLGYLGENLAAHYLMGKGYRILDHNFTIRGGEIDLIAQKDEKLVFVEVKTRRSDSFGHGEESISVSKMRMLKRALSHYLSERFFHSSRNQDFRIDLVEVNLNSDNSLKSIEHMENIDLE